MARHGENIRKRSDGRWEGRYLYFNENKQMKTYRSVYGNSYDAVKEKLNTAKSQGTLSSNENLSIKFYTVAEKWLEEIKRTRKYSTYIKYRNVYEKHIVSQIDDDYITRINSNIIEKNLEKNLSSSMNQTMYSIINQILKFAGQNYDIDTSGIAVKLSISRSKAIDILNKAEQQRLLAILYKNMDIYKAAIVMCLCTGLRLGEVCGLKWRDIDVINRTITINQTVQRISVPDLSQKTMLMEMSPKSECSRREIPFSDELLGILNFINENCEYVFGRIKPLEPRTLQYRFKKYLKDAVISDKNFHSLRHTFATNCIERGVDAKALSEILGHSDVQITLNRYVHPTMESKRKYMNNVWKYYGQFLGQTG